MNRIPLSFLSICGLNVMGCTATYVVNPDASQDNDWLQYMSISEMISELRGREVTLHFTTGHEIAGKLIGAVMDTLVWYDEQSRTVSSVSVANVEYLEQTDHETPTLVGAGIGLVVGAGVPLSQGAWAGEVHGNSPATRGVDYSSRAFVYVFGISGAFIGGIAGGVIGWTRRFEFSHDILKKTHNARDNK